MKINYKHLYDIFFNSIDKKTLQLDIRIWIHFVCFFKIAKDDFVREAPTGINQTLRIALWPDLELNLQIAEELFHRGVLSAQRGW